MRPITSGESVIPERNNAPIEVNVDPRKNGIVSTDHEVVRALGGTRTLKRMLWISTVLLFALGCRKAAQTKSEAPKTSAPINNVQNSEWHPIAKGMSYQLALKDNVFSFCDDKGAQQVDVRTGKQTLGTQKCDPKNEAIQSGCDDDVEITGDPAEPYDVVSFEGDGYKLNGHSRGCDRDGRIVAVTTAGDVELIDGVASKAAFLEADVPDKIVVGSGWVAWNSLDQKVSIRLETVARLLSASTAIQR